MGSIHRRRRDGLVFTDDDGRGIRRTTFSYEVWRPAVTAAGARRGTGFHDLRHYYASLLIRHGESVKTVQRRLGHATAAETLDTYAHLWPGSEDRTRAAIDAVLRPPPAPQLTTPRAATTRRTTDRPHRNHGGPTLGGAGAIVCALRAARAPSGLDRAGRATGRDRGPSDPDR